MPTSQSITACSLTVIVIALMARLHLPACPKEVPPPPNSTVEDPQWGHLTNLQRKGDVFTATAANGYHRILQSARIPSEGVYRLSVETRFAGTDNMQMELAGAGQPYGVVIANLRDGKIEKVLHDVHGAGVEQIGNEPGHYRWWVEQDLKPGTFDYDFALLTSGGGNAFAGTPGICRMALLNPVVTDSTGTALR